jgi:hypothetical protein
VSLIVVDRMRLPDVPVTTTVNVPVAAVLLATKVSLLLVVVLVGLKVAVTPLGRPEALRLTVPLNPLFLAIVIVLVALELRAMVALPRGGHRLEIRRARNIGWVRQGVLLTPAKRAPRNPAPRLCRARHPPRR